MYLAIITLPILGSIVSGFFGRKVGVSGAQLITCTSLIITTILAILAFFEVGLNNVPTSLNLFRWIDSESLNVLWSFHFDSLTVSMLIPVLIVSSLVHVYSIGYMSHDPHNQRFFSYLSLFTFMMIILVTSNSFLLMFVGWEGNHKCPKWLITFCVILINCILCSSIYIYIYFSLYEKQFLTNLKYISVNINSSGSSLKNKFRRNVGLLTRLSSGPHSLNVISLIVGSILGNSYLEKSSSRLGTRVVFELCSNNVEYLMWFHKFLAEKGYCNTKKPRLTKIIVKNNKVLYACRIKTYTFASFNWLYEMFYKDNSKTIPYNLRDYLTPLSLATWYLNDNLKGSVQSYFKINKKDLVYLCEILKNKYNIATNIQSEGITKNTICINSAITFYNIVKPEILPSLYYKLNSPHNKLTILNSNGLVFSSNPLISLLPSKNANLNSTKLNIGSQYVRMLGILASNIKYTSKYKTEYELSLV